MIRLTKNYLLIPSTSRDKNISFIINSSKVGEKDKKREYNSMGEK